MRFRTLGCYPLTGAIESPAASLEEIVASRDRHLTGYQNAGLAQRYTGLVETVNRMYRERGKLTAVGRLE